MSNLQHLLRANHVKTFDDAREVMNQAPYFVNVRYLNNLYRFHYTEGKSDMENLVVQECAGIILEMETNEIISYGMNVFNDPPENNEENDESFPKGCKMTSAVDGSLIRLYHYKDTWHIATTKAIDAGDAHWISQKSFKTLFLEACLGTKFNWTELNKDYTYSFVLQHPESRNVSPVNSMRIVHVATRDLCTLEEVSVFGEEGLRSVSRPVEILGGYDYENSNDDWELQGTVVQTSDFRRFKVKNPAWLHAQELKGNHSNMANRFLELRNDAAKMAEFLKYFPEYTDAFDKLGAFVLKLPEILWEKFKYYFIEQNELTNSEPMYYGIMALHIRFKQSEGKEPTTLEVTQDYVNNCSNEDLAKIFGF